MNPVRLLYTTALAATFCTTLAARAADAPKDAKAEAKQTDADHDRPDGKDGFFKPEAKSTDGTVTIGGRRIDYQAVAGTLVVHPKGWDDVPRKDDAKDDDDHNPTAEASMFYVAYFAKGAPVEGRPVTFLFNGGPGSSSVWLHMGAFGPRRVVTLDDSHTPAAPYQLVNNDQSLLDATDLVFVDAPGTGFSRLAGKDKEKAFYGIDADAHAFGEFITGFLSKYNRWNSPKYLFGESYGTTRSAVLANILEQKSIDLNGVILLSQIFNFTSDIDAAKANPGIDLPYVLALPTYAASAYYHHKLPQQPTALEPFLKEVEEYATGDYAHALSKGTDLSAAEKQAVAEKLHNYIGLPAAYLVKADLRVSGGAFEKNLQDDQDLTTGRLDTRFSGPSINPLSEEADYDPQSSAISSAYVSLFNDYVRHELKYGNGLTYLPFALIAGGVGGGSQWDFKHNGSPINANVSSDIATAMKTNPRLKVMVNGGYYDLATPFYAAYYEDKHLPISPGLAQNIEFDWYESGHMVYVHDASLKLLHDRVAAFIKGTETGNK